MNASSAAARRSEQSRACAFIHASAVLILLSARRARGTDTDAARAVPVLFSAFPRVCVCGVCVWCVRAVQAALTHEMVYVLSKFLQSAKHKPYRLDQSILQRMVRMCLCC